MTISEVLSLQPWAVFPKHFTTLFQSFLGLRYLAVIGWGRPTQTWNNPAHSLVPPRQGCDRGTMGEGTIFCLTLKPDKSNPRNRILLKRNSWILLILLSPLQRLRATPLRWWSRWWCCWWRRWSATTPSTGGSGEGVLNNLNWIYGEKVNKQIGKFWMQIDSLDQYLTNYILRMS